MRALAAAALIFIVTFTAQAEISDPQPQVSAEDRLDAIRHLDWQKGGTHKLASSRSTLSVPDDHRILVGDEAVRLEQLIGNAGVRNVEAVAVNQNGEQVIFQSVHEGYVRIDDWKDVDPSDMLRQIKQSTEDGNAERVKNGFPAMHVTGWIQEPSLDRATDTVYWGISAQEGDRTTVNSRALRLGRDGFELLTWVGKGDNYRSNGGDLDVMLRSFDFDPGSRYADYTSGDKVAAYSVAGLVATIAGVKLAKIAAAGGLLLLLKKFGIVAVAAVAGLIAKFRNSFRRKNAVAQGVRDDHV